nr:MAG TPA: hypothetical protein [Caudoviricetes sp.]
MVYATFEDIAKRKPVETSEMERCEALLEDAGIIIDAFNTKATAESKRLVSCNMVIRVLGSGEEGVPIGTTQATASALGYSQSWTNANGSGELYLTKLDKKILGTGNRIGYTDPYQNLIQTEES